MRRAERLYLLQQTDLALDGARKRVRDIEAQLVESEALREARRSDQNLRIQIEQLRIRNKDLDLQSSALDEKIKSVEERLYSGTVRNPKELSDLQRDAASLRRHKSEMDDAQLSLMLQIEQIEQAHRLARADLARVEGSWQANQSTLQAERGQLLEQITAFEAERGGRRADTPPADLSMYDQLRTRRHGTAIATLDDGVCSACGVQPPASKLTHLQRDDDLLTCGNCERILLRA